uniref:DNA 3'-5' helicase n=1 Tax=Saccoglossus kowalevskii TaxID=10224 RepID=A0ABM0GXS7_SACKO|nr:PREDICTED: ATP-dependent DNA helicase Q-like SIM-like [Saccoglossus kowalevskii]
MADELLDAEMKHIGELFGIDALYEHQIKVIKHLLKGEDVFLSTRTSSGKSLCYQAMPTILRERQRCTEPIVLIISPLISIMREQVEMLQALGFSATFIGMDVSQNQDILEGKYSFIYTNPESILGNDRWREMLKSKVYSDNLKLIVVDEAHTVMQWGVSTGGQEPFRQWFGNLGEIRSLVPGIPLFALTATATPKNRHKIKEKLCMLKCVEFSESPDRDNISLYVRQIISTQLLSEVFAWLITEAKSQRKKCTRTIIFCKSIMDTAKLYSVFKSELSMYHASNGDPLFNMYHSCTVERVKEKIRLNMNDRNGTLRILICTNAAGMGVDFKGVSSVVNYGPPQELDTFIQQLGRAGRDGSQSLHILIYSKQQLRNVDPDMLVYVRNSEKCRRTVLCGFYSDVPTLYTKPLHLCCDECIALCDCEVPQCKTFKHPARSVNTDSDDESLGDIVNKRTMTDISAIDTVQRLTLCFAHESQKYKATGPMISVKGNTAGVNILEKKPMKEQKHTKFDRAAKCKIYAIPYLLNNQCALV